MYEYERNRRDKPKCCKDCEYYQPRWKYRLIETAKENGLDPYRYLLWVLRNAPAMSQTDEAWAEQLLPANAPQECRIPKE